MVHFIVLLIEAPPGMFLYGLFVSFVCLEWSSRQPLNSKWGYKYQVCNSQSLSAKHWFTVDYELHQSQQ